MVGLFGCPLFAYNTQTVGNIYKFFDMVIDFLVGIITYFCPCYIFGKNAEQLGESCVMYALSQFVPLLNLWCRTQVRGKIREQKGIEGTCIKDLLMVWCCPLCSLVQEARVSVADI
jgi:Cys-rich protein (TIGR01571 family)